MVLISTLHNITAIYEFPSMVTWPLLVQILSKDSVTVAVDAVVYFRIFDPIMSICNVDNAFRSSQLLAATTLRNVLGTKLMSELLSDRDSIAATMQVWP